MSGDGSIVQLLHEIQRRCGYLPKAELEAFSERNPGFPLHRVHEVASFFPHFRLTPPQGLEVKVCRDMACHLAGAADLKKELEQFAAGPAKGQVVVGGVSCLGQCDGPPAVLIGERVFKGLPAERYKQLAAEALAAASIGGGDSESYSHSPSHAAPPEPTGWKVDPYGGREEYGAVRKFVANPDVPALLKELETADLRGMGGAGVPAHQKWKDVWQARGDVKYVVCNGDESEPSTFKDRELLLRTPQLVLEGVILGGLAVGAERGFIYIRHEYHEQIDAMEAAIARAEAVGACGANVFGSGRSFPVEVFVSPGGYICGEQSALIEAMEGHRAEPRNKPPEIQTNGLYDKPTLLSNVETFAWAPAIFVHGGAWYRDGGVNGHKGMRFFSVCGDLNRPGVFEVPIGITLRELVEMAGGVKGGGAVQAFAPSGPSGGFLPAKLPRSTFPAGFEKRVPPRFLAERFPDGAAELDVLDLELDLDLFRSLNLMLGAGMVVYGPGADMLSQALNAAEFFRNESCGKCVPCRLGSQKMVDIGLALAGKAYAPDELPRVEALIQELRRTMELTSICGLGAVAANPVASVLRNFGTAEGARPLPDTNGHAGTPRAEAPAS